MQLKSLPPRQAPTNSGDLRPWRRRWIGAESFITKKHACFRSASFSVEVPGAVPGELRGVVVAVSGATPEAMARFRARPLASV